MRIYLPCPKYQEFSMKKKHCEIDTGATPFSTTECAIFSKKIANFRKRATYENYEGIGFSINAVKYRLSKRIADFLIYSLHRTYSCVFSYR